MYLRQAEIADVVQIQPSSFNKSSLRAIEDFINEKYADKVIHKVGLCIGFHSLISASEGLIGHGTGIVNVNVDFRMIVWRPARGDILRATIAGSNDQGIYLTMGFFDDIIVPSEALFEGTTWEQDPQESSPASIYVWRPGDDQGGQSEFFFDRNESVQFRVEEERWTDLAPQIQRPKEIKHAEDDATDTVSQSNFETGPYRIIGSMMLPGLGPTMWWIGDETIVTN